MSDENTSPIVRFGQWMMAIIFLVSGPVSGYFLFQIYLTARASAFWPSVPGTITQAEVSTSAVGRFRADVSYTYSVEGRPMFGNRVRASDGEFSVSDGAKQIIDGLAIGQQVDVHYDPSDPTRSLLQPGAGIQEHVLLVVPVVMLLIGAIGVRQLWGSRTSSRPRG